MNLAPLLPLWEKGLGDEGNLAKLGCSHPLTHSEVETLLNQGFEIFNRYSQLYRASSWSRQIIGHDDYRFLLRLIKLGLKYYDENIHTEFAAFPNEEDGLY
ncbi:hypothetical protein BST81_01015 [Leptolyngbya sp. 'hensonii']|uniref:hypothetical protein n=1 Tax=Leptolyngbya sp. 'hensonii' TaxID=1922337 RepID=UPI00094F671D|nr:hypothetical protein [Leptolyngbya sp. 'hensonii']OLP20346.1 hypothetical protein BST81_01015 [Leptolyngbya sp. 'hensonii']